MKCIDWVMNFEWILNEFWMNSESLEILARFKTNWNDSKIILNENVQKSIEYCLMISNYEKK